MTVVRNAYRMYNATLIKQRAHIPDQADMTVIGSTVECNYITKTKIKTVLGSASNLDSELCTHANINHWSAFGPTIRSISGSDYAKVLVNSDPTGNYKKGSFAGYHHDATAPGWQTGGQAAAEANIWVNNGDDATIEAQIDIGELNWEADFGAAGVAMLIFNASDAIVGWGQIDLSTVGSNFTLYGTVENVAMDHLDYYGMIFITDTYPIAQAEDVISSLICRIPNISTFEVNLKVKYASTYQFTATGNTTLPSPWAQNSSHAMNWSMGVFNIGSISRATACKVKIYVRLVDWLDQLVASGYIVGQAGGDESDYYDYDPLDGIDITGTVDLGNDLEWGYKVYIDFEYFT